MLSLTTSPDVGVPARRFVPDDFDAGDLGAVQALAHALLGRPLETPADLEGWLLDWNELLAQVVASRSRRRIAMSRDTADEGLRRTHLTFEKEIWPEWERLDDRFQRRYLECGGAARALGPRYAVLDRRIANRVELFNEANVELRARDEELRARYSKISGTRTVAFRGDTLTVQQASAFLEEQDRATRDEAYRALTAARAEDADETEELFDQLLALRGRIATNAGLDDYRAYAFKERERFDYGPDECFAFHDAVEKVVVPAVRERAERRRARLGLDRLHIFDFAVDPDSRPPLRPFREETGLIELGRTLFRAVDSVFEDEFAILVRNGLLDLMSRPGKAPGGYNSPLMDIRLPFVFANAIGRPADVKTLLHEGGHAFHSIAVRDEPIVAQGRAPIEFCEVAAMAMELFGLGHYEAAYGAEDARAAAAQALEQKLGAIPWIATVDAFQHWLYTHPGHTRQRRADKWVELRARFAPHVDWTGYEAGRETEWHQQLHLFKHPFYYIEYGIAQVGALQLWRNYRADPAAAVAAYRAALKLGGTRSLPDLFAAAGARFSMDETVMREVIDDLMGQLRALD